MPTEFVNHPDIKLFETKEKARVWLQKFREAENSLGTLSTPQEGVNPMTNFNTKFDADEIRQNIEKKQAEEVLVYQAEEDVMPVDDKPEAA